MNVNSDLTYLSIKNRQEFVRTFIKTREKQPTTEMGKRLLQEHAVQMFELAKLSRR